MDYHGEQIQLAGRFEKPAVGGPLPVVILLHNCAGIDGSPSLAVWAPLMWAQGYATLRLDSFTARGYHKFAPMGPRYDLASARRTCSPQPTCSPLDLTSDPTGSPYSGFRTAAVLQFMSPEITRSCALAGTARDATRQARGECRALWRLSPRHRLSSHGAIACSARSQRRLDAGCTLRGACECAGERHYASPGLSRCLPLVRRRIRH